MYNIDLRNVAPSGGLTCLFTKATLDESNLWHRRLGHINFKTMNILMDVKSVFLYGTIEEEVYVSQPPGVEDSHFLNKVYMVEKALYGLHQALKAWCETLFTYLLENRFRRGTIDKTLFIKKDIGDILLVPVYVDNIIFGSTKKLLCDEFEQMMHKRFQMSSMEELTFFLGLQKASTPIETNKALLKDEEAQDMDVPLYRSMIRSLIYLTASRPGIMFAVCACARFQVTPKVSHLHVVKRIFRYLNGQPKLGLWYPRDSPFDLEAFSDSDYVRASLDRKSITGVNEDVQIRALIDGKKIIVTETSIRRDLQLQDAEGTACLPNDTIFKELARMRFVQVFVNHQLGDMSHHKRIFVSPSLSKKVFAHIKREEKGFSGIITPSFETMMVQAPKEVGEDSERKETEVPHIEPLTEESIPTTSNDPLPSGEDIMQLSELMELCTKLSDRVLSLEQIKTNQAAKIEKLKKRNLKERRRRELMG
nr:hypothetical protein [Tanacetum cinerariifolium]